MKAGIRPKLFLSHFLAVFLVSGSIGTYFYLSAVESLMGSLQSRLKSGSALISEVLDATDLEEIRTPDDINHPSYVRYLKLLRNFKKTNPDIAFLYIMRLEGERSVFVVDSDETQAQALPGRPYEWKVPSLKEGFFKPTSDEKIYTDEWGSFMSGYAPIKNGAGRYLVGMDMRADEVKNKLHRLRMSGLLSLFASLILAVLFSHILSASFVRRIKTLAQDCRSFPSGVPVEAAPSEKGDELDGLSLDFKIMARRLNETMLENGKAREALVKANEELEERVKERTAELTEINERLTREIAERKRAEDEKEDLIRELKETLSKVKTLSGLLPICSSCKKIRDDKGYWNQLEAYIRDRSEAEFTHSICPECKKRLYPELN
jgi:hypothetical protein